MRSSFHSGDFSNAANRLVIRQSHINDDLLWNSVEKTFYYVINNGLTVTTVTKNEVFNKETKWDQIRRFLRCWSHLPKNFQWKTFCAVSNIAQSSSYFADCLWINCLWSNIFLDNIWIIKVEVNAEIAKCVDLLLFVSSLPRSVILISIKVNWIDGQEIFLTTIGLKVLSVSDRKKI